MGNQKLIEQYKEAYKKANMDDCPYRITCRKGVFYLENRKTGFDYQCRKHELVRIIYSLHARTR